MKRTNHLEGIVLSVLFVITALSLQAQPSDDSTFSLLPGDITEATIDTSGGARLRVTLTPEKSAELSEFTGRNLNKQVKIVVGWKLRSQPFIREQIPGPSMEIYVSSPEDAVATVKTLLTSNVKFDQLYKWTDASGQTHYSEKPASRPSDQRAVSEPVVVHKNTFQALQGSWVVATATMNGKQSRDPSLLAGNWTFKGNELLLESPQKGKARFTLQMDAKAEPKSFHLTSTEPANGPPGWMLFSREGKNLRIAFYDNLQGRPESFELREPRSEPELIVVTLLPAPDKASEAPVLRAVENSQILELKSKLWEAIRTKNADAFIDCYFIEERFNTPKNREDNRSQAEILLRGESIQVEIVAIPEKELTEILKIQNSKPASVVRYSLIPKMMLWVRQKAANGTVGRGFLIGDQNGKWYIITLAGHTT